MAKHNSIDLSVGSQDLSSLFINITAWRVVSGMSKIAMGNF